MVQQIKLYFGQATATGIKNNLLRASHLSMTTKCKAQLIHNLQFVVEDHNDILTFPWVWHFDIQYSFIAFYMRNIFDKFIYHIIWVQDRNGNYNHQLERIHRIHNWKGWCLLWISISLKLLFNTFRIKLPNYTDPNRARRQLEFGNLIVSVGIRIY